MKTLLAFWRRFSPSAPLVADLLGDRDGWVSAVREAHAAARVEQVEARAGMAALLALPGPRRIDLMRADLKEQIGACQDLLFRSRIDAVMLPADAGMISILRYHQFNVFSANGQAIQQIGPQDPLPVDGWILALHHRFTTPVLPGGKHMDLPGLFRRYAIEARGVIHIGAHEGEELETYLQMGFKKVLFIEANPVVYARLAQRTQGKPGVICAMCAISDENGLVMLRVTSNDESSSILQLKRHLELYPQITETSQVLVASRRLDHLLREIGHNPADYNFLHLDIQGAELKALRGSVLTLSGIDAISSEVNYEELYEGCPLVEDLDDFLEPLKFERIHTFTPVHPPWGDAFYLRQPTVTMRNLGRWGRFGNQVFEYAFTKIFAKRHRLHVETGSWIGNQLFGASEPVARRAYPQYLESTYALADSQVANVAMRPMNLDLCGVFQYHSAYFAPHKEYFRSLFKPVPALQSILDQAVGKIREKSRTLVALHLRRGDYGYGLFFIPPNQWYLDWLAELWPRLESPALYIAADEPGMVLGDFARYQPITAADLKLPAFGADYYPDFYMLSQADHAAISNSSYSFSACMLNERGKTFLRPDLFAGKLVAFDPWNAEPLLHRELGILDYRQVQRGIPEYLSRPNDQQLSNTVRSWRHQVADSWSQIKGEQLPIVLSMDLWTCYQQIQRAKLRTLPLADAETQLLGRVQSRLAAARGLDAVGPYLAATLYLDRSMLPEQDLSALSPEQRREVQSL